LTDYPKTWSNGGSRDPQRKEGVFSSKGRAGEKKEDTGVGVKKGVKKDRWNQAVFGSINSSEGSTKKSQGKEGGAVQVNRSECESGQPLGLGNGEATGQPREKSSTKKNLLPDRGDHQSISEKGSEGFGISCFEESRHGWLGLEREAE